MRGLWGTTALAALLGLAASGTALAQQADEQLYADSGEITVTATRSEADVFNVPSVVSVIDAEEIEENLATDIKDLIRFEPGVSVPTSPSRFGAALGATGRDGNSGFTIRGMGGNRVLLQVDGIRIPDGFSFGPNAFGRGDYVDLDLLQSVEIVRGPASALYGSDGLAGVVSFITRDPVDFLREGENFGARARVSYGSVDESIAWNLTGAGRLNDQWSALLAYTRRDGQESENQGEIGTPDSRRTIPNPQDYESNAVLARLVFEPNDAHRFRLTGDYGDRYTTTEALSGRAVLPPAGPALGAGSVIDLDGEDESERQRITLDWTYENEGGFFDSAFVALYAQQSWLRQFTAEDRNTSADRTRETTYDNDVWGVTAQGESEFGGEAVQQRFVYGLDYSVTTQGAIRGGTVPTPPAVFPERPFPETEYTRTGLFLVDEISLLNGSLLLFPGVRYDEYELEPQADALYFGALAGQSGDQISPKFGIVAWPIDTFGVFFNYAAGFKAPAPSEVNNYFENLTLSSFGQAYTSIPNPALQPETSEGYEFGIRGRGWNAFGAGWDWSASAFANFYDDFIIQDIVSGSGSALDPFVYQYINLNEVEISGVEGRLSGSWSNGFGLNLSAAYAEGEQITPAGRAPLETVDPFKLVLGFSYDASSGNWGGQAIVTHAMRKDKGDVQSPATAFRPDAFTILDLTAYWHPTDAATVRVGVFNVTDEEYWWWSDARGLSATSAVRDAYTQPGRNVSVSLAYRF
ncbi:MAG: TonB-dependent hemoglobin/transferrin/lactoferrin family receptor [Alphaproteobacteria bacterium]|nr:MAG: TonB-dependent hemoglobin/transferrin/lactoferrin family receptor [Alphaproteobacteria bacterium]